jgi:drug/metabolite transporter (DMT)-like permease
MPLTPLALLPPSLAVIIYPLVAAFLFTISALLIKRTSAFGLGLWRTAFLCNMIVALVFVLLWPLGGPFPGYQFLWQPAVAGFLLVAGQTLQFLAIDRGDISVAIPVFGVKVILVAFLTQWILGESVSWPLWVAAFLSVGAVLCLNQKGKTGQHHNIGLTLIAGGGCAICFALFDVLVQKWAPAWGVGRFLPLIFWMAAGFSVAMIPLFNAPLRTVPRQAWPWLISGGILLGLQSVIFISTFAVLGKVAVANVAFSSRGLWSVVLVWLIGHWFHNQERHHPRALLLWRLMGAILMMTAIALVFE